MDLKQVNEALNNYLRLQTFPVAIRLYQPGEQLPPKIRIPTRDLGLHTTFCQGIAMARRYGWTVAVGKEDQPCPFGALALGFVPPKQGYLNGSFDESHGYMEKEAAARAAQSFDKLEYGKYDYMVVAPLHRVDFEPHVIVVYGNPAQVSRLVQGRLHEGGFLTSTSVGGIACSSMIAHPMLADECQCVVAGAGDRYFALTQDDEMCFTMPISKVEKTIYGLEESHRSGTARYPTLSFLRFEVKFPPRFDKLMDFLKEGN